MPYFALIIMFYHVKIACYQLPPVAHVYACASVRVRARVHVCACVRVCVINEKTLC